MTFNPTIYADPQERAEARERYYAFDDERGDSAREFRHEREQDRISEIPHPEIAAMHTDDWIPHTPGDPMPCEAETMVSVLLAGGNSDTAKAGEFLWGRTGYPKGEITHWKPA